MNVSNDYFHYIPNEIFSFQLITIFRGKMKFVLISLCLLVILVSCQETGTTITLKTVPSDSSVLVTNFREGIPPSSITPSQFSLSDGPNPLTLNFGNVV